MKIVLLRILHPPIQTQIINLFILHQHTLTILAMCTRMADRTIRIVRVCRDITRCMVSRSTVRDINVMISVNINTSIS